MRRRISFAGGRFTTPALDGMVLSNVNTLRELRRSIRLKPEESALLLQVPLEFDTSIGESIETREDNVVKTKRLTE